MRKLHKFTLMEILIAIGIIAVLIAISSGTYSLVMFKVKEAKTMSLIKKLETAMRSYKYETGYYFQQNSYAPLEINENDDSFRNLIDYTKMINSGEIKNNIVFDAWGDTVMYQCPGSINTTLFDLGSAGPDGKWGQSAEVDPSSTDFGQGDDITNTNM